MGVNVIYFILSGGTKEMGFMQIICSKVFLIFIWDVCWKRAINFTCMAKYLQQIFLRPDAVTFCLTYEIICKKRAEKIKANTIQTIFGKES